MEDGKRLSMDIESIIARMRLTSALAEMRCALIDLRRLAYEIRFEERLSPIQAQLAGR